MEPNFDLNLLRILVALASTRNVTEAAHTLEMSQSGFSSALARLRNQVGDPLFVRTESGMSPTPRATALISVAQDIMSRVTEEILVKPDFDPSSARTTFRFAIADSAELFFLPKLLKHLQRVAPYATVHCSPFEPEPLRRAMSTGEVDLALGYFPDLDSEAYFHEPLYHHTYVCLVRKGHPLLKRGLTEESYLEYAHVMIASPARSNTMLERHLARRGIKRQVVLQTPHHLSLPAIIEDTDLVATISLATAVWFAESGKLEMMRLPFSPPTFLVQQHWHTRVHQDPRCRWLRSQITELFKHELWKWKEVESDLYGRLWRKLE